MKTILGTRIITVPDKGECACMPGSCSQFYYRYLSCSHRIVQVPYGDREGTSWDAHQVVQAHGPGADSTGEEENQSRYLVRHQETDGVSEDHL